MKIVRIVALGCALFYGAISFGMQMQPPVEVRLPVVASLQGLPEDVKNEILLATMKDRGILTAPQEAIGDDQLFSLHSTDLLTCASLASSPMRRVNREYSQQFSRYYQNIIQALHDRSDRYNHINLVIDLSHGHTNNEKIRAIGTIDKMITVAPANFMIKANQLSEYVESIAITPESFAANSIENIARSTEAFAQILDNCTQTIGITIDSVAVSRIAKNRLHIEEIDRICKSVHDNASRRAAVVKLRKYAALLRANYTLSASTAAIVTKSIFAGITTLAPYIVSTVAIVAINQMLLKHFPKFYATLFYSAYSAYGNNKIMPAVVFLSGCGVQAASDLLIKKANVANYQGAMPAPLLPGLVALENVLRAMTPNSHLIRPLQQINAGQMAPLTSVKDAVMGDVSAKKLAETFVVTPLLQTCSMAKFSIHSIGRHLLAIPLMKAMCHLRGSNLPWLAMPFVYAPASILDRFLVKNGFSFNIAKIKRA